MSHFPFAPQCPLLPAWFSACAPGWDLWQRGLSLLGDPGSSSGPRGQALVPQSWLFLSGPHSTPWHPFYRCVGKLKPGKGVHLVHTQPLGPHHYSWGRLPHPTPSHPTTPVRCTGNRSLLVGTGRWGLRSHPWGGLVSDSLLSCLCVRVWRWHPGGAAPNHRAQAAFVGGLTAPRPRQARQNYGF